MQNCGETLRELRGERSQKEVAESLGISTSAWAMYERNERIPRDDLKVKIARLFKTTVQDIFFK